MYIKKIYDLGDVIEIMKYYPGNYGAPGSQRGKKRKRTPEDIERQNCTNRWKKIQRIILANFKPGDWHLILKYKKGSTPSTYKEAVAQRKKFLDAMREIYKKAGIPFKWIAVTERGKKGQVLHHHLVIEDITDPVNTVQLVKMIWTYGTQFYVPLYEDGEYEKLAQYIVKAESKEECGWATYSRSRNLIIPEAKKEKKDYKRWRRDPKPPEGWYIIADTLWNGTNPYNDREYQHYMMRRLVPKGGSG